MQVGPVIHRLANHDAYDISIRNKTTKKFQRITLIDDVSSDSNSSRSGDDHQNLKLLSIDLNQMHLIGLVERTIFVFKSSKSDVSLQSYGL